MFLFYYSMKIFSPYTKIIELRKNIWTKEVWHKYYSNFLTGARGGWEGDQLALTANDDTSLVSLQCLYYHSPSPVMLLLVCIVTPDTACWWHVDNHTNNVTPQQLLQSRHPEQFSLLLLNTLQLSTLRHFVTYKFVWVIFYQSRCQPWQFTWQCHATKPDNMTYYDMFEILVTQCVTL